MVRCFAAFSYIRGDLRSVSIQNAYFWDLFWKDYRISKILAI